MRVITVEGTPEEFARLHDLTGTIFPASDGTGEISVGRLDGELRDFILSRAQGKVRFERASEFVAGALARGDIEVELGKKGKDGQGNYLLLYKKGPRRFGAAAYVTPGSGKTDFRLPEEAASGRDHAKVRQVRPQDRYKVRLYLEGPEATREALDLLDEAIKKLEEGV